MVAGASADDGAAFESFRAAFADAQAGDETNDPSLNMLLGLAEPSFAAVIQNLSVPHWFDEQIVAEARAPGETLEPAAIIEELADLPFVRLHPRGYAYHDVIRSSLRDSVMRRDVSRLRRLCCGIGSVLDGRPEEDLPEEIAWESVYLLLGCDEAS